MLVLDEIAFATVEDHRANGEWPLEWLPVKGLIPYIRRLGKVIQGIEIGVARGESSYAILENCQNVTKIYGIDPYIAFDDWNGPVDQEHNDKTKEIAIKNMAIFGDRFQALYQTSKEVLKQNLFSEKNMDFVFVDGDHSYEGVKFDLNTYYNFVRPGGIFSGHDYNLGTVRQALNEFRDENKIRIPIQIVDNNAWFWIVM